MTLTYIEGEVLLAEQVAAVEGFNSDNVGRGDKWRLLNTGKSDHYAILRKGQWTEPWLTMRTKDQSFRTIIEVVQRLRDNQEVDYDACLTYADLITARIDQYRKLSDTDGSLRDANITGGGEAKGLWLDGAKVPAWIAVELYVDWSNEKNVTFAE